MHLLRNAVCHGIESPLDRARSGKAPAGLVALRLEARRNRLHVAIEDDGRGVDMNAVSEVAVRKGLLSEVEARRLTPQELGRLIFQPGLSTSPVITELSGRGMGLSVVEEQVKRLQGEVALEPRNGSGTCILLAVPLSVSAQRVLLIACGDQTLAIPVHAVQRLCRIRIREVQTMEGEPVMNFQGRLIPLVTLAHLLELPETPAPGHGAVLAVMVLKSQESFVAVAVDAFLNQRDAVVKPLGIHSDRPDKTAGGILLEDGTVAVVLNTSQLLEASRLPARAGAFQTLTPEIQKKTPSILVVDDSITTRSLEKSILESHGYEVRVAVDGVEALTQLRSEKADLVITDLQMPRMDGFDLLEAMKKDNQLAHIPVIIVTSLERREDQEKGLALGADAYVVKRKFDQRELLEAIGQIV
jgi:two-component system chemotaxis sensor kinase CheA